MNKGGTLMLPPLLPIAATSSSSAAPPPQKKRRYNKKQKKQVVLSQSSFLTTRRDNTEPPLLQQHQPTPSTPTIEEEVKQKQLPLPWLNCFNDKTTHSCNPNYYIPMSVYSSDEGSRAAYNATYYDWCDYLDTFPGGVPRLIDDETEEEEEEVEVEVEKEGEIEAEAEVNDHATGESAAAANQDSDDPPVFTTMTDADDSTIAGDEPTKNNAAASGVATDNTNSVFLESTTVPATVTTTTSSFEPHLRWAKSVIDTNPREQQVSYTYWLSRVGMVMAMPPLEDCKEDVAQNDIKQKSDAKVAAEHAQYKDVLLPALQAMVGKSEDTPLRVYPSNVRIDRMSAEVFSVVSDVVKTLLLVPVSDETIDEASVLAATEKILNSHRLPVEQERGSWCVVPL